MPTHLTAIASHRSEYPDPISLTRGESVHVGEHYEGTEGWDNWYYCSTTSHSGGWVPGQLLVQDAAGTAIMQDDYTARELDVDIGDQLLGGQTLNGWRWCERPADGRSGWVPEQCLYSRQGGASDRLGQ